MSRLALACLLALFMCRCSNGDPTTPLEEDSSSPVDLLHPPPEDTAEFDFHPDDRWSTPDGLENLFDPQWGDWNQPCGANQECDSGYCIQKADGSTVCTRTCIEECPGDWQCQGLEDPPDWTFVCLPPGNRLCQPCTVDLDCSYSGDLCLPVGDTGTYCAMQCFALEDCPQGYLCTEVAAPGADEPAMQCLPATGSCVCTADLLFTSKPCFHENDFGLCLGHQTCEGPPGWSECDAAVAAPEVCNGRDDNCNGAVDEEFVSSSCTRSNLHGDCDGFTRCDGDAGAVCDAPTPQAECCDGIDNDCDGVTDESFLDTDADKKMDCVDLDDDGDGVLDPQDNCPLVTNLDQEDFDQDGQGDLCDTDDDNDNAPDQADCAPLDSQIHPFAVELCDGVDNNCNGIADEMCPAARLRVLESPILGTTSTPTLRLKAFSHMPPIDPTASPSQDVVLRWGNP